MDMAIKNRFGILLAEKRIQENQNIPISEVAGMTKISRPTLNSWANNNVTRFDVPVIDALCKYFGVKLVALLEYVDGEKTPKKPQPKKKARG